MELENDNGCLVYGVSLSQGLEVKVDAGTGVGLQQDFFGRVRPFLPESLKLPVTPLTSPREMIKMIPCGRLCINQTGDPVNSRLYPHRRRKCRKSK